MAKQAAAVNPVGRPIDFPDSAQLGVNSATAKSKLQANSDRRAVVNRIIDQLTSSVEELDAHFGFSTRPIVLALIAAGWLYVVERKK